MRGRPPGVPLGESAGESEKLGCHDEVEERRVRGMLGECLAESAKLWLMMRFRVADVATAPPSLDCSMGADSMSILRSRRWSHFVRLRANRSYCSRWT
jgi:hypothetical protein